MQALKIWRAHCGKSTDGARIGVIVTKLVSTTRCGYHCGLEGAPRVASLSEKQLPFGRSPGYCLVQVRNRGLLRKAARAQLFEKNAKSCIILSPEDKIQSRPSSYKSLFPCPDEQISPRIEHLVCLEDGNVVDLVSKNLGLPREYVEELVHFGAIYYALVCPTPPKGSLSPVQWELYKKVSALSQDKKRPSLKGKTIAEAQKTYRISNIHEGVEAGSYLRVHVHIKRFPRCYEIDWKSRVIAETESYVVLDKPAGVPVGGALDNLIECCAVFTGQSLGLKEPLRLTHQLDNCTEGCVVLAKTKEFASEFHLLLRKKEIQKHYCVLAAAPVPLGMITHYMRPSHRHPRILSPVRMPGWAQCQLEVLECNQISWPTPEKESKYRIKDMGWKPMEVAYECKVHLITGRTHQVRAQFAALKAPVVGDSMYAPAALNLLNSSEMYPFSALSTDNDDESKEDIDIDESVFEQWAAIHGPEPECAIGLQAYQISWANGDCVYEANDPWWR